MTPLAALAGLALAAWIVAVMAALRLMAHRLPGRGIGWYLVRGYAFFDAGQWAPSGRPAQRLFLAAAAVFFLAVVAAFVVALATI